jgi:hypothetical protein
MSKRVAPWKPIVPALVSAALLSPGAARAQGDRLSVQGNLEYIYSDFDGKIKATGEPTDTTSSYFKQLYDIDFRKELFPYLSVRTGGQVELINSNSKADGVPSDFDETLARIYAGLDITNPLYTAGTVFRRRIFEFDPGLQPSTTLNRQEVTSLLRWRPAGLPLIDVDYTHSRTWDEEDTRDATSDLLILKSRYQYADFGSDYTYTRNSEDERFGTGGALRQFHNAGLHYIPSFLGGRLDLNTAARINYESIEPAGAADVELPTTSPGSAFFLTDDADPDTLTPVSPTTPLTTINIGRNGPMNAVAVGLDFGPPTEVDTLHVQPLEDLDDPTLATPAEIASVAGSFVWTVFTSDDQENWTEQVVVSATYSIFENRFEIRFTTDADAPFVKVVTTPLTMAAGEIRIAALQAFTTVPGAPGLEIRQLLQTYNLNLRWAITGRTRAAYDSFVRILETDPLNRDKTTITNGVSLQHDISPIFYADARVLRNDTFASDGPNSVGHTYTASLGADFLPTFNQRLIYSGRYDQEGDLTGYANSILLRSNADVYRDLSVNLDLGYAARNPIRGDQGTSTTIRLITNIAPNPRLNFAIDYRGSWDTESERPSSFNQIARVQAFWVPFRTLSLFASVNLRYYQRDNEGLQVDQNYSINWSPFPDGLMTFNVAYNQTIDALNNESRILTPEVNWQITRKTLLTVSFNYGTIESETETLDVKVFRTTFRTYF